MVMRKKSGGLTTSEKAIVKALLAKGWRNQDIQAIVNIGRDATINSGRITGVKQDSSIIAASDEEVEFFKIKKDSYDQKTGLNLYDDERLIRAREAIVLAVQIFNSPALRFKTEVFAILANVAWTYLLHEFYNRKSINIIDDAGFSLSLSQMLKRNDNPLSKGVKDNLTSLKTLRDEVEHKLLGRADARWLSLFQACCLNFDKTICDLFGERLTLSHEISFALQFASMEIEQISMLNNYAVPAHIKAIDARLTGSMTDAEINDLEYQFRVIYTLDAVTKSRAHFQFFRPDSAEGKAIHNVLVQDRLADDLYPHRPKEVVALVQQSSGKKFTSRNHTQAWRQFNVRPRKGVQQPDQTNRKYCVYHTTYKAYTYSKIWVELLTSEVNDAFKFAALKSYRI